MEHYVFSINCYVDDDFNSVVELDSFHHLKSYDYLKNTKQDNPHVYYKSLCTLMGKDTIDEKYEGFNETIQRDVETFSMMEMRCMLNCHRMTMHTLTSESPIERDELQVLLDAKKEFGELKTFLTTTKV